MSDDAGYSGLPSRITDKIGEELCSELVDQLMSDRMATSVQTEYGFKIICTALGKRLAEAILGPIPEFLSAESEVAAYKQRLISRMLNF